MRRLSASDIVLTVLGLLLLTAAVLKGHELLSVPVAGKDLWSWRPFLIVKWSSSWPWESGCYRVSSSD